jgi:hypothetical protein
MSGWDDQRFEAMMMQQATVLTHAAGGQIIVTKDMLEELSTLRLHKEVDVESGAVTFRVEKDQ